MYDNLVTSLDGSEILAVTGVTPPDGLQKNLCHHQGNILLSSQVLKRILNIIRYQKIKKSTLFDIVMN